MEFGIWLAINLVSMLISMHVRMHALPVPTPSEGGNIERWEWPGDEGVELKVNRKRRNKKLEIGKRRNGNGNGRHT